MDSQKTIKQFYISFGIWGILALMATPFLFSQNALPVVGLTMLCIALGFKITELLIAIMTGVRKANFTAIALLMVLKLLWWCFIFWSSRHISKEMSAPIALGLAAFLCSMLSLAAYNFGLPKISEHKNS